MHFENLIEIIKRRKEMMRVTQERLAELSGVWLRTLKQFESGKGNHTVLTIQKLADVLGMGICLQIFKDGTPAYITKRFDVKEDGSKLAQDDFASLAGKTPQSHGEHYKYLDNYTELLELMKVHLPAYKLEARKLFKL